MNKSKKLKELNSKINKLQKKIVAQEPKQFKDNGSVNMESVIAIQKLYTELRITEKKINFLNQGKSYLGEAFGDINQIEH